MQYCRSRNKRVVRHFLETHLTNTEWRNLFNSHFRARKSVVPVYLLFQQWARYSSATISRSNTGLHSATLFITHFYFLSYFQCVWEYHFFHILWLSLSFFFFFSFCFHSLFIFIFFRISLLFPVRTRVLLILSLAPRWYCASQRDELVLYWMHTWCVV